MVHVTMIGSQQTTVHIRNVSTTQKDLLRNDIVKCVIYHEFLPFIIYPLSKTIPAIDQQGDRSQLEGR